MQRPLAALTSFDVIHFVKKSLVNKTTTKIKKATTRVATQVCPRGIKAGLGGQDASESQGGKLIDRESEEVPVGSVRKCPLQ